MRHHNLWKKTTPVAALALASILALGAPFAAFADDDDDDTPLTLIDGYIDDDEPEEDDGEEDVEEEDLDLDWEEDEGFEGDDEQSSPEDLELQDYFDANAASDLIELYGSLLYKQTMWNADGSETAATGFIYENKDVICRRHIDKFEEIITKDDYVGYDNDLEVPVRYVFDSDDTRAEMVLNYEELVYLWGNEHVVGKQDYSRKKTAKSSSPPRWMTASSSALSSPTSTATSSRATSSPATPPLTPTPRSWSTPSSRS